MSLEDKLRENIREATQYFIRKLGLSQDIADFLEQTEPNIEVRDDTGIYAGYHITDNKHIFSREAIDNYLAIGEEVFHSIRFRLDSKLRDFFSTAHKKLSLSYLRFIKAVNLEEWKARYAAYNYADYKGQRENTRLWSTIESGMSKSYVFSSFIDYFQFITHIFGYKMAEREFNKYRDAKMTADYLINDTDYSQISLKGINTTAPSYA